MLLIRQLRFLLIDKDQKEAFFDYPLHDAGAFDDITNRWIHCVLTVESDGSISVYVDGKIVANEEFNPVPGYIVGNEA